MARLPADRTPVDLLTDAGHHAVAAQLQGTVTGATETRDGIYETARQYASCLLDPEIAAWVTPARNLPEFKPAKFATSRDTLYLLSKDGGGSASAIIAAAADAVMRAAVIVAERSGGRLDPPALCVLDEAANVCRISDLPDLYSHLGSRGVIPITILQSYRQGQKCWGEQGMDALWSAATVKVIGSGIDDADFADRLSRMIGDHDVQTTSVSTSDGGKSTSVSMRTDGSCPGRGPRAPQGQGLAPGHRNPGGDARPAPLVQGALREDDRPGRRTRHPGDHRAGLGEGAGPRRLRVVSISAPTLRSGRLLHLPSFDTTAGGGWSAVPAQLPPPTPPSPASWTRSPSPWPPPTEPSPRSGPSKARCPRRRRPDVNPLLFAEQAVLGAVLLDPGQLAQLEWREPDHFYRPVHQALFTALRKLRAEGHPAVDENGAVPLSWVTDAVSEASVAAPGCPPRTPSPWSRSARAPARPGLRTHGAGGSDPPQRDRTRDRLHHAANTDALQGEVEEHCTTPMSCAAS